MNTLYLRTIKTIIDAYPAVIPHLRGKARFVAWASHSPIDLEFKEDGEYHSYNTGYKTYDFFLRNVERLIRSVYEGNLGGEFLDIMANLIQGQFAQAYNQAWNESGLPGAFPTYLNDRLMNAVINQFVHVDQLYRDIVDARVDGIPIDPLLARAALWANRWNEAYDEARHVITLENGGREAWVLGATEQHCETCQGLDGIVAYAQEWEILGVRPQGAPNPLLSCGGWRCDCRREPTDKPRTDGAFSRIQSIIGR